MRCFVAVELSPALRQPLIELLKTLPESRGVRWCTEDQLHVTLKFLGEVRDADLPRVTEVVREVALEVEPFSIRLSGVGGFPSRSSPRVLWVGLDDPAGGCARWVELAEPRFAKLGFEPENRPFTAHVTLGRSKDRDGSAVLRRVLEEARPLPAKDMQVAHVVLFESRLRPQGALYVPVLTAPLGQVRDK
jgi:2'-5' RNA ligase